MQNKFLSIQKTKRHSIYLTKLLLHSDMGSLILYRLRVSLNILNTLHHFHCFLDKHFWRKRSVLRNVRTLSWIIIYFGLHFLSCELQLSKTDSLSIYLDILICSKTIYLFSAYSFNLVLFHPLFWLIFLIRTKTIRLVQCCFMYTLLKMTTDKLVVYFLIHITQFFLWCLFKCNCFMFLDNILYNFEFLSVYDIKFLNNLLLINSFLSSFNIWEVLKAMVIDLILLMFSASFFLLWYLFKCFATSNPCVTITY